MPLLCVVSPPKYIFRGAYLVSTIALNLQQKPKPFQCVVLPSWSDRRWIFFQSLNPIV